MCERRAALCWRYFLAAYTLLAGGLLAGSCLLLYTRGTASGAAPSIFSWENVHAAFRTAAPWLYGYLLAVLIGLIGQAVHGNRPLRTAAAAMTPLPPLKGRKTLRIVLFSAALALIGLGILNGGMRDVLIKAINICTECIGLG